MDSCVTLATAKEQFEETLGKHLADELLSGLRGGSRRSNRGGSRRNSRGGGKLSYITIVVLISAILGVGLCMYNQTVVENVALLKRSMGERFLPMLHLTFFKQALDVAGKANLLNTVGEKLGKYAVGIKKDGFNRKTALPASAEAFLGLLEKKGGAAQAEAVLTAAAVVPSSITAPSVTAPTARSTPRPTVPGRSLTQRSLTRRSGVIRPSRRSLNSNMFEMRGDTLLIHTSPPLQLSVRR